jgi:alkaline phosphatase D
MKNLLLLIIVLLGTIEVSAQKKEMVIGFGSCLDQDLPAPLLDKLILQKPELFIFMGDNIYKDTTEPKEKISEYEKFKKIPQVQWIFKNTKVLSTWDDHDYGLNDSGGEYENKSQSQKIFLETFDEPKDSPRWTRKGIYDSFFAQFSGKTIQFIILDTRYFRGPLKKKKILFWERGGYIPNEEEGVTMLGEEQWKWLDLELNKKADLRILVSSIQFHNDHHRFEKWGNLPREKQRMLELLKFKNTKGLIFLSGDRHIGEFHLIKEKGLPPIYEITSSPLNREVPFPIQEPFHPDRMGNFFQESNFGIIRLIPIGKDLDIFMELHLRTGLVVKHQVKLSDLEKLIE